MSRADKLSENNVCEAKLCVLKREEVQSDCCTPKEEIGSSTMD